MKEGDGGRERERDKLGPGREDSCFVLSLLVNTQEVIPRCTRKDAPPHGRSANFVRAKGHNMLEK